MKRVTMVAAVLVALVGFVSSAWAQDTGTISVTSDRRGTFVHIDDRFAGIADPTLTVRTTPGHHVVRASAEGYQDQVSSVFVTNATVALSFSFLTPRDPGPDGLSRPRYSGLNLALRGRARQSSTYSGMDASRAVDGNTDGSVSANSVSHTGFDRNAWWEVDLGAVHRIRRVTVFNRTDSREVADRRLDNFTVQLSERPFGDGTPVQGRQGITTATKWRAEDLNDFEFDTQARYVRIQLQGQNYLHLAEVEVYDEASLRFEPKVANRPGAIPVTIRWHAVQDAEIYLNGERLEPQPADIRTRPSDPGRGPVSARAFLADGDVFTVAMRSDSGRDGFMLVAVDENDRPVFWSDYRAWKELIPAPGVPWGSAGFVESAKTMSPGIDYRPPRSQEELSDRYNSLPYSITGHGVNGYVHFSGIVDLRR